MKTLLIADDEPDVLKVISAKMEKLGFKVLRASGGHEAVQAAIEHKPDLILMDVLMPDLPGGDAVKKIASHPATSGIPVIFLSAVVTGSKSLGTAEQHINVGGIQYVALPKPLDTERLMAEINRRIGR